MAPERAPRKMYMCKRCGVPKAGHKCPEPGSIQARGTSVKHDARAGHSFTSRPKAVAACSGAGPSGVYSAAVRTDVMPGRAPPSLPKRERSATEILDEFAAKRQASAYVENKAPLTGQRLPARRIHRGWPRLRAAPGFIWHWRRLGRANLAEAL